MVQLYVVQRIGVDKGFIINCVPLYFYFIPHVPDFKIFIEELMNTFGEN